MDPIANSDSMIESKQIDNTRKTKEGKLSQAGSRRRRKHINKNKSTQKQGSIDKKLFPDAVSIPTVGRDHGYASALVNSALQNVKILEGPDFSFYLVDLQSMLQLFLLLEDGIRMQHRSGGWQHEGYYTGLFFRSFAARLQRVAIFTELAVFNQREMITQPGEIPILVAYCINQFGVKTDHKTSVTIAPFVNHAVIAACLRISRDLMRGPTHGTVNAAANHAAIIDPDNWGSWIDLLYGTVPNANVICGCAFRFLGVGFVPAATLPEIYLNCAASADTCALRTGAVRCTGPEFITLSDDPSPLLTNAVVGGFGNNLAPIPGVIANVCTTFDDQTDAFSSLADPFNGSPLPLNSVAAFRTAPSPMTVEHEVMELRARYTVSLVSLSPEGSFAPLVVGSDLDANCTASCAVPGLTEIEYLFGILLDLTVVFVDRRLLPFNFAAASRHKLKYKMSALPYSRADLIAKAFRECVTRRKG